MVALHHAATQPGAVQLGRLARPHLQAQPGRQGARRTRPVRQTTEAVRLDSRDGVSVGERGLRRGTLELAGAEADFEAVGLWSFRDGPKDQTRNLEIPGSMLRIAPE